jgi:intracellular sulfur oxidation DsrE/DsrF family protein
MKLSRLAPAFGLFLVFSVAAAPAAAAEAAKSAPVVHKVVYHADFADPNRVSSMILNINNMVTTYQEELEEYDVRIVFVASGIRFVTDDPLKNTPFAEDAALKARRAELLQRLAQLRDIQEVKLELCEITRTSINLPKEKIIPGVTLVTSGVVRIAELQSQGFAYIKVQ